MQAFQAGRRPAAARLRDARRRPGDHADARDQRRVPGPRVDAGDARPGRGPLHRIGQQDAVTAWYLLAAGTIDETMAELIARKRGIVGAVTDGRRDESEALVQCGRARAARRARRSGCAPSPERSFEQALPGAREDRSTAQRRVSAVGTRLIAGLCAAACAAALAPAVAAGRGAIALEGWMVPEGEPSLSFRAAAGLGGARAPAGCAGNASQARSTRSVRSPDGRLVAFQRDGDLFVARGVGRREARLVARDVQEAAWSPDGRRLAFIRQP